MQVSPARHALEGTAGPSFFGPQALGQLSGLAPPLPCFMVMAPAFCWPKLPAPTGRPRPEPLASGPSMRREAGLRFKVSGARPVPSGQQRPRQASARPMWRSGQESRITGSGRKVLPRVAVQRCGRGNRATDRPAPAPGAGCCCAAVPRQAACLGSLLQPTPRSAGPIQGCRGRQIIATGRRRAVMPARAGTAPVASRSAIFDLDPVGEFACDQAGMQREHDNLRIE